MSYGLMGLGRGKLDRATRGLGQAAQMEQRRASTNDQLKSAAKAQQMQMVGTGAGLGAMAAMAAGGPVGWSIGAGAAAGYLLNEIF